MNKAVWSARRNYWIAGIGAIISAFSFLALPLVVVTVQSSISIPILGGGGPKSIISTSMSAMELASHQGLIWVSLLFVLAVLGVSILFLVRQNPFGSNTPVQVQARWTAWGFVAAGVLSALSLVMSFLLVHQLLQSAQSPLQNIVRSLVHADIALGIGGYLFLAGLVAIVVAGILELRSPTKMLSDAEMRQAPQNQYPQYNYPPTAYGPPSMGQGPQSFTDATTQYRGNPAGPHQPPSPPYGQ
jgi:hypothetical protein